MSKSFMLTVKNAFFVAVVALLFPCACNTPAGSLIPGNFEAPSPGKTFDAFFTGRASSGQPLAAGAEASLPEGGALQLPRASAEGIDVGVLQGSLTQDAIDAFADEFADITLAGSVSQITVRPTGASPGYLILRLPATDSTSRIMFAGELNADTGNLAWEPLATQFDAAAGMATALIGWEQLARVETTDESTPKSSTRMSGASPLVYTGHVAIGVGRQFLQGEVVFLADEPTTALSVPFGGPPIPVRARIGLKLSNITHEPLDSLTVTSGFGPRQQPVQGASTNHKGCDYRAVEGSNVYAAGDGVVITSRCANGSIDCGRKANGDITGGYIVEIQHADGEVTRYMHLTNPAIVPVGVTVEAGQLIAFSGKTGGVAPHLHFEIRKDGVPVNPDLVFSGRATATLAMAVDHQIEFGTAQQIPVTRGIITPADMATYVNVVELTDVEPGSHKLQFVLVQPHGQLAVLAEVPLTVLPAGDFVGTEEHARDITWSPSVDLVEHEFTRSTSSFSVVAKTDGTVEGTAHITFETHQITTMNVDECPVQTIDSDLVSWDTPVTGSVFDNGDGTVHLRIDAAQTQSAPFIVRYRGCDPIDDLSEGHIWAGVGANLVNGRFDVRIDDTLGPDYSGQSYYELHVQKTNRP